MEEGTFETLIPSRYISFTLPLNSISSPPHYFHTHQIQISVLDSPSLEPINPPQFAAMLVPKFLENDWIFSTESGHLQLLYSFPDISRLILIGNAQDNDNNVGGLYQRSAELSPFCRDELERCLYPLLTVLLPKEIRKSGDFHVPFLRYEDNVVSSVVLDKCVGDCVGEMVVEDVEIEGCSREFRRRLRFKRMPNLVQSEISIVPRVVDETSLDSVVLQKAEFWPNLEVLVHPYLGPMVAGLALIAGHLQERFESGVRPRACCLGVGGGALLSFLSMNLGFEVDGVEVDEVVLSVAENYFGLETGHGIRLCVGDGIEILKKAACDEQKSESSNSSENIGESYCCRTNFDLFRSKFDVIMVDLDSSDPKTGVSAPTLKFLQKDVLLAAKSCLSDHGILVINVIARNQKFYDMVLHELREAFNHLHELDVGNGENFILIASKTSIDLNPGAPENVFMHKLKSVISETLINAIRQL